MLNVCSPVQCFFFFLIDCFVNFKTNFAHQKKLSFIAYPLKTEETV